MIKIFRKGLQAQSLKTARGGHGWDAPPPPLPAIYEHKRIVSVFDSGMWWGCGTAPEYLISYFEMHLHDQYGAGMEILRVLSHSLTFGVLLGFCLIYGQNTFTFGQTDHVVDGPVRNELQQQSERPFTKKNVFGFNLTHDDAIANVNYDIPNWNLRILSGIIAENEESRSMNEEAKNFMLKLQAEAKKKYE